MDKTTVQDALTHLSALGFVEGDTVLLNCLPIDGGKGKTSKKLSFVYPDIDYLGISQQEARQLNIFYCPNRAYKDKDVTQSYVLFYEHDDLSKEESVSIWQRYGLPEPTIQVDTGGKSVHSYYVLSTPVDPKQWVQVQTMLVNVLKADTKLVNPARLMRLAGGVHPKTGYVSTIAKHTGYTYTLDELAKPLEQHYQPITPTIKTKPSKVKTNKSESELLDEVRSALMAINSPQYLDDEDGWHKVGMALKATSESLFDDWVRWSEQSPKSLKCNFAYRWSQWQGEGYQGGYTYKSIFRWAYDCGWRSTNAKYLPSPSGTWEHLDPTPAEVIDNPFSNAVNALTQWANGSIRYNKLLNRHEFNGEKKTINQIIAKIRTQTNISMPRWDAPLIVDHVALENSYNPIVEYLQSCKVKSNVSHTNIASKYWGGTKQEDEYFSLFLKAAVLRQINELAFTDFPFCLVLIGSSGCGKTATFSTLFKSWIYSMSGFHNGVESALTKSWLCFWDEMVLVLKPENRDKINEFITKSYVSYNVMYVSKDEQKPTPFVIGGTTTDYQFLSDTYSQRRWMVCKVPTGTRVNIPQLRIDVDAIWASAYQEALTNPSLGSFDRLIATTTRENQQYICQSDYYEVVSNAVETFMKTTGYDFVFIPALNAQIWQGKTIPPRFTAEVKAILTNMGYSSKPCKLAVYRDKRIWSKD